MCDQRIREWVQIAIENEKFREYEIEVHGKTGKADGYLGKVAFVTVTGVTKAGHKKSLNLVIKSPSQSSTLREQIPIDEVFQKEIYIYDEVVTSLRAMLQDEKLENLLDFLPQCYATRKTITKELIILENLKFRGYDLYDRKIPMTQDHIQLVLQTYGRWHALSFALKKKRPEIFEKLVRDNVDMFCYYVMKVKVDGPIFDFTEEVKEACDLLDVKQLQFSRSDVSNIFKNLFCEDPEFHVILHGDCWTNNLMFQYQKGTNRPTHVCIIDWQLSGLASPVMDLSYFIYTCTDTEANKDVRDLLKIYYESLEGCLRQLGCEPRELFPYEKLLEHWCKFSPYGLFLGNFILKFSMCEADEAPDFTETAEEGREFLENLKFSIQNQNQYYRRVKANLLHYVHNLTSL
ncbi:uncharacterized protein [Tenebrio molitor]|uniref:uncharacterized protein n=1 Tax=Tenebrio molitor TaxID=7067 RepID=UPI0036249E78